MADETLPPADNTANNSGKKPRGKPFVQGDPRINRRGRPVKTMSALQKELQDIWSEIMFDGDGKPIIDEVSGKALTRLRARLRVATSSRNTAEFRTALEYAYGRPRENIDITSGGDKIIFEVVRADGRKAIQNTDANPPRSAGEIPDEPGKA